MAVDYLALLKQYGPKETDWISGGAQYLSDPGRYGDYGKRTGTPNFTEETWKGLTSALSSAYGYSLQTASAALRVLGSNPPTGGDQVTSKPFIDLGYGNYYDIGKYFGGGEGLANYLLSGGRVVSGVSEPADYNAYRGGTPIMKKADLTQAYQEGQISPSEAAESIYRTGVAPTQSQIAGLVGQPLETTMPRTETASLASATPGGTEKKTLIDIANSRPDVLNTAKAQGGDPFTAGTKANTWLNDWWNSAGKNEYPGVTLAQPGVSFNDTFGEDTNNIVGDSSSIDANEATVEAKRKEEEAKTLADLQVETEKLTYAQQTALLKKDLETMGIDWQTGQKITKPPLPSYESTGKSLMSEYGIEQIQNDMNSLDSQIADLQASMRAGMYDQEGKLKPMELIGTAQRELARQGQEALDTLARAKAVLVDQYNTKVGLINTLMGWKSMDYSAAVGQYNADFSNALSLMQIVQGRMDDAEKEKNAVKDSASANLTLITKMMEGSGKIWNDLDVSIMAQVYKLEVQAGLPPGITRAICDSRDATRKESFHIVSEDQTQATIFYTDGTSKTFDTGLTAKDGSGGFTAWQQYQMSEDVKAAALKETEKGEKTVADRDAAFEKYVLDLVSKIYAHDMNREQAKQSIKTAYPDYNENVIYDFITDEIEKSIGK